MNKIPTVMTKQIKTEEILILPCEISL